MNFDEQAVARAAERLGKARLAHEPVRALPADCRPSNEADGYRVQDALKEWFESVEGMPAAGFKIGCTTATMQQMLGVPSPARGCIRASVVHAKGTSVPHAHYQAPAIECEIAFRIGCDIDGRSARLDRKQVAAHIAEVMPAIEIVDNRYGDWTVLGTPTLIADDFFHSACVLGTAVPGIDLLGLDRVTGRTSINGQVIGEGSGGDVLGHPLDAVAWLAECLAQSGQILAAGLLVMTGSMVRPEFLENFPADAKIEIDGLGAVNTRIE